jgi:elongation factor P
MDASTYEQFTLDGEVTGDLLPWLQPETRFVAEWLGGKPISIQLPSIVELAITDTTPVVRGATKTASTKPATLENGVTIQVPEFVENGIRVRVNPNTGEYIKRAK